MLPLPTVSAGHSLHHTSLGWLCEAMLGVLGLQSVHLPRPSVFSLKGFTVGDGLASGGGTFTLEGCWMPLYWFPGYP